MKKRNKIMLKLLTLLFIVSACSGGAKKVEQVIEPVNDSASVDKSLGKILFDSDFENETSKCWDTRANDGWNLVGCNGFINIGQGSNVTLSENEISHSGNKSLKIIFTKNNDHVELKLLFQRVTIFILDFMNISLIILILHMTLKFKE